MSRALLAVGLSALAAAGCGVVASSNPSSEDDEASIAPFALEKSQARALARSMQIRTSDLPQWGTTRVRHRKLPEVCERVWEPPRRWYMGAAASPMFVKSPELAWVASGTAIFKTEAQARTAFARTVRAMRGPRAQACFSAILHAVNAGTGISFSAPRVRPIGYTLGERSGGFRWTLRVGGTPHLRKTHMTLVHMYERQAVSFVFSGRYASKPFERELEMRLGRLVAKRMQFAQDAQTS